MFGAITNREGDLFDQFSRLQQQLEDYWAAPGGPASIRLLYADVRSTRYQRAFTLSDELDTGAIRAELNDGVLAVTIPKKEEVRPRKIEVSVG